MDAPYYNGSDERDELGYEPCPECDGSGVCPYCDEDGCDECDFTGCCQPCGGEGEASG